MAIDTYSMALERERKALAERDAALAEVARLSHALAEAEENINLKADFIDSSINDSAAMYQRAIEAEEALAAETAKREAMEEAGLAVLQNADRPGSRACLNCGPDGEDTWIDYQEVDQSVLDVLSATLAKNGSKT